MAVSACYDYALAYGTPFISGKDSMFNDFKGYNEEGKQVKISVPPTLLISSIGIIDDISEIISIDVKFVDDLVYILGETKNELAGSEYYSMLGGSSKKVPVVDALKNKKTYHAFYFCLKSGLIASAISVNRGGLAVALAKMSMAGMLGIEISLKNLPGETLRDDFALFSESQGRILLTISPKNKVKFEKAMKGCSFAEIGKVTGDGYITINGRNGQKIIRVPVIEALKFYKSTFKNY